MKNTPIYYGKESLELLIESLNQIREGLDDSFNLACKICLSAIKTSHIILSGIGKAGIISQKIATTFSSLGIEASFLHPVEALHGDIGRFSNNDVAILLSKSGETEELNRLLPHLKKLNCKIISITVNEDSTLGRSSDCVLKIPNIKEAGPLSVAPTTSATSMMAIGDALVTAVSHMKGLTKEEYAMYHPGGELGRSVTKVTEIMRSGDMHCIVSENDLASDVISMISKTKGRPGAASIVDKSGKLVGVFTDGDLRRCYLSGADFLTKPIKEVMGKTPKTVTSEQFVYEALEVITGYQIDQVVVINSNNEPIGIIDIQELIALKFIKYER